MEDAKFSNNAQEVNSLYQVFFNANVLNQQLGMVIIVLVMLVQMEGYIIINLCHVNVQTGKFGIIVDVYLLKFHATMAESGTKLSMLVNAPMEHFQIITNVTLSLFAEME